ncbi:Alpha-1,3-mannosyltransferase-like protein [Dipsacomyces acuminosporus]|nr:Alpha-1,3-mannosyltransferase-like protein [Dipsacomyces acuminosporus]
MPRKLSIAFVHPDLGIGGAERLVVDAAISLQKRGHKVVIYTMHHDISHCFEETRDGTLDVRVGGNWLVPPSIGGRFHILCTVLRSLLLARQIVSDRDNYDALFVDQLSAPIPLLKFTHAHIFFYCHFPDMLQAKRESFWRKLCVVYTPTNEHLGIVPLEAMYMRIPVVAVNSGGPRETVAHGKTGYLCDPTKDEFAKAILKIARMDDKTRRSMGDAGHQRVKEAYGLDSFGAKLERLIIDMFQYPTQASLVLGVLLTVFIAMVAGITAFFAW